MDRLLNLALALTIFVTANYTQAAVYKWVDANGKVHYSDQPIDPKVAQEIQITPTNTMEGGHEIAESASRHKENENAQQAKPKPSTKKQEDPCKNDVKLYRAFTEQQFSVNGRPKSYYLNNPDGSSMTEKEQSHFIQRLGEDLKYRGCI